MTSSCVSGTKNTALLLSYPAINFLIVINMYIAVILKDYSQTTEDVQESLTNDDMYSEVWQYFDPDGSRYIPYEYLSDFLDVLEASLKVHKPNKFKIVSIDIPIYNHGLVYCVDKLNVLTRDFLTCKSNPIVRSSDVYPIYTSRVARTINIFFFQKIDTNLRRHSFPILSLL